MISSDAVKAEARARGFDLCGIAPVDAFPELAFLDEWLARGYAGTMAYIARSAERRRDVRAVLPSARSVIVTGTVYNVDRPYSTTVTDARTARVARYAWGDDYHAVIGARLDGLVGWMRAEAGQAFDAKWYVDTGPVQERVYAQHGGIGWIGKNTCLISETHGSWVFLSEILCSLPLTPDAPGVDRCGTCTRCLDACPTGALVEPHVLDATRCLSYLTIERKTEIPLALRGALEQHVYGCDICQDVCPWNRDAVVSTEPAWQPRPDLDQTTTRALFARTDDELRTLLKGSAMRRAGVTRLRRNLAVALGNGDDPAADAALAAAGEVERVSTSPALAEPLVVEHVAWARQRRQARPARL